MSVIAGLLGAVAWSSPACLSLACALNQQPVGEPYVCASSGVTVFPAAYAEAQPGSGGPIDSALEREFLSEPVQLTREADFERAGEAYFSPDSRWIIFQAVPSGEATDGPPRYSMYVAKLERDAAGRVVGAGEPIKISEPGSANTCGWFHPSLPGVVLFGSTIEPPASQAEAGYSRDTSRYTWEFPREMEIVTRTIPAIVEDCVSDPRLKSELLSRPDVERSAPMFTDDGYDAEGSWSPDGRFVLYTHVDPETQDGDLYIRDIAAGVSHPIVTAAGYDGGPFFSPDGKWITYRSDRRDDNLLQLFIAELDFNAEGVPVGIKREIQLTDNRHVNWAPFWHPSGDYLVYATSEVAHTNYEVFAINAFRSDRDEPIDTTRLTYADGFDGLPVFNRDGSLMMWTGQRGEPGESGRPLSQLYVAEVRSSYPAGVRPLAASSAGELHASESPVAEAMERLSPDARAFHQHVATLAGEWLAGRLPGSEEIAIAERYIAHHFEAAGLEPMFGEPASGVSGWYQPFSFSPSDAEVPVEARNVVGLLPGRGELAERYVVVGAHHDHLGTGGAGSMSGSGEVHEGADDNASGVAAVLLLADELAAAYDGLSPDADARSVVFVTFSAEEQGLNGSRHFVEHAPMPMDRVDLMLNFDMIGRITGGRVSLAGAASGEGLGELLAGPIDRTSLRVRRPDGLTARSDHAPFHDAKTPVLFMTIDPFHDDYHTPGDEAWKINAHGASLAVAFAADVLMEVAQHDGAFAFRAVESNDERPAVALGEIKVRFGIMPGNYNDDEPGVEVERVSPGASAERAGVRAGDRLMAWDGKPIASIMSWMEFMAAHEPGDVVVVTVRRDGELVEVPVELMASSRRDAEERH